MEFTDDEILRMVGQLAHFGKSVMDGWHIIPTNWFDMDKQQLEVFSVKMMERPMCHLSSGSAVFCFSDFRDALFVWYALASSGYKPGFIEKPMSIPMSLYFVFCGSVARDAQESENKHDLGE